MTALSAPQIAEVTAHHRDLWNRCAPTYAEVFSPLTGSAADTSLDLAGVGHGTVLLDVGTGPGTLIDAAVARGASVSAVDLAPAMVEQARGRHPGLDIRVADGTALPYADASFDAVTLGFCLHHTADPIAVLAECRRVLRSGGRISLTVWASPDQLEAFGMAFTAIGESVPLDDERGPQPPVIGNGPDDYRDVLTTAGFAFATARTLELTWDVADGGPLFDGFDRFLDLSHLPAATRETIRRRLDQLVDERRGHDARAHLPNPAIVAAALKP